MEGEAAVGYGSLVCLRDLRRPAVADRSSRCGGTPLVYQLYPQVLVRVKNMFK